jgi:hypothetical protein
MPLLPDAIRRVLERVLGADGHADQSLRTAVADTAAAAAGIVRTPGVVPAELELFVNKVIHSPYKVVDRRGRVRIQSDGWSCGCFRLHLAG